MGVYLKTVFACVSKDVLKPQFQKEDEEEKEMTSLPPPQTPRTTVKATVESPSQPSSEPFGPGAVEIEMMGDLSSLDHFDHDGDDGDDSVGTPKQQRTASQNVAGSEAAGGSGGGGNSGGDNGMVVGFVSDVMSSYNHIKKHKEKFILFASLSVALGLALFLAMVLWGVYRSSRLSRLKRNVPRPGGQQQQQRGVGSTIDAYYSSPASSPTRAPPPGGAVDLELEVGDHEVDSAFREPPADPLVVAPVASSCDPRCPSPTLPAPFYHRSNGTLPRRCSSSSATARESVCLLPSPQQQQQQQQQQYCDTPYGSTVATLEVPPPLILSSPTSATSPLLVENDHHHRSGLRHQQEPLLLRPTSSSSPSPPPAVNWVGSTAAPSGGILRNSVTRESPAGSVAGSGGGPDYGKVVRYSTIGRPRVSSPTATVTTPFILPEDADLADPKSLTLSRVSNADHLLYG